MIKKHKSKIEKIKIRSQRTRCWDGVLEYEFIWPPDMHVIWLFPGRPGDTTGCGDCTMCCCNECCPCCSITPGDGVEEDDGGAGECAPPPPGVGGGWKKAAGDRPTVLGEGPAVYPSFGLDET